MKWLHGWHHRQLVVLTNIDSCALFQCSFPVFIAAVESPVLVCSDFWMETLRENEGECAWREESNHADDYL